LTAVTRPDNWRAVTNWLQSHVRLDCWMRDNISLPVALMKNGGDLTTQLLLKSRKMPSSNQTSQTSHLSRRCIFSFIRIIHGTYSVTFCSKMRSSGFSVEEEVLKHEREQANDDKGAN
jgi:hypothetical protein